MSSDEAWVYNRRGSNDCRDPPMDPIADILNWYPVSARPDFCVGVDDRVASGGEAPPSVLARFAESQPSLRTAVWSDPHAGTVGVISDHGAQTWRHDPSRTLVLSFQQPSKGDGWITLELRRGHDRMRTIAFASRFASKYWDWMKELATAIANASRQELQLEDDGFDC